MSMDSRSHGMHAYDTEAAEMPDAYAACVFPFVLLKLHRY